MRLPAWAMHSCRSREILALFTGDVDAGLARGAINEANAERLRRVVARSTDILLEVGLELVDTFVPMGSLIAAVARLAKKATGLEKKLADLSERQRPGGPAPTVAQEQIFEQYLAFLRRFSSEQPIVILLDDLHWGDSSSISLLFHIARRIESYPILLIGSYRPSEIELGHAGQRHPLEKMLAELKRYGGETTVDLDRAAARTAAAFVDAFLDAEMGDLGFDFRRMLAERTQGNPLFVVEMLSILRERGAVGQSRAMADGPSIPLSTGMRCRRGWREWSRSASAGFRMSCAGSSRSPASRATSLPRRSSRDSRGQRRSRAPTE